jgi:hypothetical protein
VAPAAIVSTIDALNGSNATLTIVTNAQLAKCTTSGTKSGHADGA